MKIREMIKTDFWGAFFNVYDSKILDVSKMIGTSYMRLISFLRGVKIGRGCVFYGRMYFRRKYSSSIIVGDHCRLRSCFLSNYVGLNRRCLLSTHAKGAKIIIGNNSGLSGTVISAYGMVQIGNNVLCGGNTFITDFDWHAARMGAVSDKPFSAPVIIEDHVWLGLNVVVLKGVRIGRNSIIGANSIVTKSIPENVIAAGNPCRVIKKIEVGN